MSAKQKIGFVSPFLEFCGLPSIVFYNIIYSRLARGITRKGNPREPLYWGGGLQITLSIGTKRNAQPLLW
jgi:hypothetical protein